MLTKPKKINLSAAFTALEHPNVDLDAGIISDVIVMSIGPIKWNRGYADNLTLETVRDCAIERFGEDGFPIIFNPETLNHGPGGMAGCGKNLRITERGLVCDVHLLQTFSYKDYLVEIATRQPKTVGLSIEYYPEPVNINGKDFMRCLYFDGAAVVYTPAATPSLYSTRDSEKDVDTTNGEEQPRSNLLAFKSRTPIILTFKR